MAFSGKVIFSHIDFSPTYAIVSFMVMVINCVCLSVAGL